MRRKRSRSHAEVTGRAEEVQEHGGDCGATGAGPSRDGRRPEPCSASRPVPIGTYRHADIPCRPPIGASRAGHGHVSCAKVMERPGVKLAGSNFIADGAEDIPPAGYEMGVGCVCDAQKHFDLSALPRASPLTFVKPRQSAPRKMFYLQCDIQDIHDKRHGKTSRDIERYSEENVHTEGNQSSFNPRAVFIQFHPVNPEPGPTI